MDSAQAMHNVLVGQHIRFCVESFGEDDNAHNAADWQRLLEAVKQEIDMRFPPVQEEERLPPMDAKAAVDFEEAWCFPYGFYSGKPISEVPVRYILAVVNEKPDHFKQLLIRYVKSTRFQQRQDQE